VRKRFGAVEAVGGVDFEIRESEGGVTPAVEIALVGRAP